ncbi:hypothetical protein AB205_0161290, partial [Aquarana catesbeiana]
MVSPAVLRSLNPAVFRNVEYEVWMKSQRDQQRMDFTIAAGMQYSVGDKCKVRLEYGGTFYNAHIQEVVAENGPAVVFVEELGKKKVVPLKNLKPVPLTVSNKDGWSTVAGKKLKKSCMSGPVVQFEKDSRGQKSLAKPHKTQSVPSPRLQQTSGNKQHGLPADQTVLNENKVQSKTPKVPGRQAFTFYIMEENAILNFFCKRKFWYYHSPDNNLIPYWWQVTFVLPSGW